jgi:hypothetical protein
MDFGCRASQLCRTLAPGPPIRHRPEFNLASDPGSEFGIVFSTGLFSGSRSNGHWNSIYGHSAAQFRMICNQPRLEDVAMACPVKRGVNCICNFFVSRFPFQVLNDGFQRETGNPKRNETLHQHSPRIGIASRSYTA